MEPSFRAVAGAVGLALLLTPARARADNPIVQHVYTADPAPMVHGDTVYLCASHDEDETLNGFFTNGSQHAPVTGTAFTRSDGSVLIGVYVHGGGTTPASMDVDFVYDLVGDASLTATGVYRYTDGQVNGYAATWNAISCKSLATP